MLFQPARLFFPAIVFIVATTICVLLSFADMILFRVLGWPLEVVFVAEAVEAEATAKAAATETATATTTAATSM